MKILIAGTSNIGALKSAAPRLANEFPGAEITFYGLPGGKFNEVSTRGTAFGPRRAETDLVAMSKRINGVPRIDLAPFDRVFVITDTLGLAPILWLAARTDVVDWPSRRGVPLISDAAFEETIAVSIAERTDHLRSQFADIPLHVARSPYPTQAVARQGPHLQKPYDEIAKHPEAARIEAMYNTALTAALTARDMVFVPQPEDTIAQPFLTLESCGIGALDFRNGESVLDDHRHMNADFGASLIHAFALSIGLRQTPTQP